jgi:5-methylcytosine-specific restriction endonuclease McrA
MTDATYPHKTNVRKRTSIAESQNHRCAYCGIRCNGRGDQGNAPTIDHIIPIGNGGTRSWDNEVLSCRLCNGGRSVTDAYVYFAIVGRLGRKRAYNRGRVLQAQRAFARVEREIEAAFHRAFTSIAAAYGR